MTPFQVLRALFTSPANWPAQRVAPSPGATVTTTVTVTPAPPPAVPVAAPTEALQGSPVPGCTTPTWVAYEALLRLREGCRLAVYRDSVGKATGGIGHLMLDRDGPYVVGMAISQAKVDEWFLHDGAAAMGAAVRQAAEAGITSQAFLPYLASVCFQLGLLWTAKFPNTWKMICAGNYAGASLALDTSAWAGQTPVRVYDFKQALKDLPPK